MSSRCQPWASWNDLRNPIAQERAMASTKDDSIRDGDHDRSDRESALFDARTEDYLRRTRILRDGADHTPFRLGAALYAAWRELCSLNSRIAILRKNNWFPRGVSLDQFAQPGYAKYPLRCTYPRVRIRGIRRVLAIHPKATLVDFHILLTTIDPLLFP